MQLVPIILGLVVIVLAALVIRSMLGGKPSTQGIELEVDEGSKLKVAAHVDVYFGQVLPEVADRVRTAIADAVASQVGVEVSSVDVYVVGIQFAE